MSAACRIRITFVSLDPSLVTALLGFVGLLLGFEWRHSPTLTIRLIGWILCAVSAIAMLRGVAGYALDENAWRFFTL